MQQAKKRVAGMKQASAKQRRRALGTAKQAKRPVKAAIKTSPLPEFHLRPRRPEDDSYIVALTQRQLGAVHEGAFGEPFPEVQFLQYIRSGAPTFIIEQNGQKIGYYSYLIGPADKMHISAMVIQPDHQSSGIGTAVMEQIEKDAKNQGIRVLEVFVQANNEPSLQFTRQLGFREVFQIEPNTIAFQKQLT
ncbi:MAG: GNAT family N-acetyltransferase [Alicyclobacillaceae bacterium]|jgi:ribosomal protein S18 acetylase RimI-like enzyme|nr:GNAT family N-acetyltransferase [Alicyclobacillaceae bacterium]